MNARSPDFIAIEGCIANAEELLLGARGLLQRDDLPLAYHVALLALEEIGNARTPMRLWV